MDIKIFIDLDYNDTKKAQVIRGKEIYDAFRIQILKKEHEVIQNQRQLADFIIRKDYKVMDAEMTKAEIRSMSREFDLPILNNT